VAGNVREGAASDPEIATFTPPPLLARMTEKNLLGGKTGGGFYRKVKSDGGSVIEAIDPSTLEYRPKAKARFPELDALKAIEDLEPRLKALTRSKGKGSEFAARVVRDTLRYAAAVADEIAFDIASIDRAMRWGFGWDLGPFETWDAMGLATVAEQMAADGKPAPDWVLAHIESGATSFYDDDRQSVLSPRDTSREDIPARKGVLDLRETTTGPRCIKGNAGASLWDLGDGVLGLEFHSKMNSLGGDAMAMAAAACELAESGHVGIVVGNQGANFSVGANVALLLMAALEGEYDDIDLMVRQFQHMTMGLRRCTKPVVVAPFNLTLGGGAEITLHGDAVVASAELYMGLVEAGVGLIPAGGGTKETYLRMLDAAGPSGDPRMAARRAFETIGLGKVSTSAHEAEQLGFLGERDRIVLNRDHVLAAAKAEVLALAQSGYRPPPVRAEVLVGGDETYALLEIGLYNFQAARQISEHDALIGRKLAQILSGGAHRSGPSPRVVSEQHLLDLEREAFLSLCGERKTLERIQHMLTTGKPLRN
jgi:3-hydroxyacyl-CoA dehydrogenase